MLSPRRAPVSIWRAPMNGASAPSMRPKARRSRTGKKRRSLSPRHRRPIAPPRSAWRLGEPVAVHVLAFPGRVFKAELTYVAPAIDPDTHRLPVRAEVDNPEGALKPGMF